MLIGMLLAAANYGLTFVIARAVGEPLPELLTEVGFPFLMNLVYFVSISAPLVSLLGMVIG